MMIETSVNINIDLRDMLVRSAKQIGVTKQALVHVLFCKVLQEARLSKPVLFQRVSYQDPDPDRQWKNEPITLRPDMYEKCHDMRRMLKLSVSFLLAYAIRTYLNQVIRELATKSIKQANITYNYSLCYSMQSIFSVVTEGYIVKWDTMPKKNE